MSIRQSPINRSITNGLLAWALGLFPACTAPHFPEDAGGQTLPEWAEPLLGTYAVTGHAFARGSPGSIVARVRALGIGTFAKKSDGSVSLTVNLCSVITSGSSGRLSARLLDPTKREPSVHQLHFDLDKRSWDSIPVSPAYFGADEEQPEACASNIELPAASDQAWTETCSCRYTGEPYQADDCRLRDPDEDGFRGFTIFRDNDPACGGELHATESNVARHIEGKIDPAGEVHSALVAGQNMVRYYPPNIPDPVCTEFFVPVPCPERYNTTTFKRVTPDASCDALLASEQEFFGAPPGFPDVAECTQ